MATAFEQVVASLPKLTPTERLKLKMLLTKHPGGAKADGRANSVNRVQDDWLLQGMLAELKRRGQVFYVPTTAHVQQLCAAYALESQAVREELERQICLQIERPTGDQLKGLGVVCARALIRRFSDQSIGLQPLLQVAGRTLEALEDSFPGYLGSGMVYCLIQRKL